MGHKTVAQRRQAPLSDEEGGGGGSGTAGRGPTLVREQREGAGAAGPCSALALHLPWLGPLLPLRFRAVLIEVHSILRGLLFKRLLHFKIINWKKVLTSKDPSLGDVSTLRPCPYNPQFITALL